MQKNGILYVALLVFSNNVVMCVNNSLLGLKHVWLHMVSSQHCCVNVVDGNLENNVDEHVYPMSECEQEAQRVFSPCASWMLQNTCYKVRLAPPLDSSALAVNCRDVKPHRFVYDSASGLALALIDIFQPTLSSFREKLWCLYAVSVVNSAQQPGPVELMCELLKPIPKLGTKVLKVHILQNGKRILFFLANGTVKIISPRYEITLPFLWNMRNNRVADLSFSFK